jgi:hypothetical protein
MSEGELEEKENGKLYISFQDLGERKLVVPN